MVMSGWENSEEEKVRCALFMKGTADSSSIESVTRQKPYDTLFLKQVGVKPRYNKSKCENQNPFLISASNGCSTSHMKPEKSERLTQTDPRLCLTLECQKPDQWWSFGRLVGRRKANPARSCMARGSHVSPQQTEKSKYRTLRAICARRLEGLQLKPPLNGGFKGDPSSPL